MLSHGVDLGTELQDDACLVRWGEGVPNIGAAVAIDPGHESVGAKTGRDMVDEERGVDSRHRPSNLQTASLVGGGFEREFEDEVERETKDAGV